jgi:hypothetical protein
MDRRKPLTAVPIELRHALFEAILAIFQETQDIRTTQTAVVNGFNRLLDIPEGDRAGYVRAEREWADWEIRLIDCFIGRHGWTAGELCRHLDNRSKRATHAKARRTGYAFREASPQPDERLIGHVAARKPPRRRRTNEEIRAGVAKGGLPPRKKRPRGRPRKER